MKSFERLIKYSILSGAFLSIGQRLATDTISTIAITTVDSVILSGLNPSSIYTWSVRAYCDDGTFAPPSDEATFTTADLPPIDIPPLPGLLTE